MGNEHAKIDKKDIERIRKESKSAQKGKDVSQVSTGTIIFRICCALIAVAYFVLLIFGKYFFKGNEKLVESFNPFSKFADPITWVRVISICIFTLTCSFVIRYILGKLTKVKIVTKKVGIALLELLSSFIKYAAFLIILFMVLVALGVNAGEILAGLGILALIIGLGVTSLIEDIVAGIFIIVERLFDVNDIIVVDGFRGTVISIGIRSTKLLDVGGDIMTMRNSSIGSLVNLTDRLSSAAITIPIAPTESIDHVDEVVKQANVDQLREKYANIESGPYYLGLYDINSKGVQMVMVVAGCKEDSRYEVERILFKEFKLLFENSGVKLGLPDLTEEE